MKFKTLSTVALGAILLCGTAATQAHDLVLMPIQKGEFRIRFGHPQDWQSVDNEKLLEVETIDAAGTVTERHAALKRRGLDLVMPLRADGALMTAARYDNGLWVTFPAGEGRPERHYNASKFMMPDGGDPLLAVKFAKGMVLRRDDATLYRKALGHLLEIVPQKNPLALKAGESLPVLVLFKGQPLAGAGIEVSDMKTKIDEDKIVRYKTGPDGVAQVRLRAGLNVLAVDHSVPNDGSLGEAARALPVGKGALIATYTFGL